MKTCPLPPFWVSILLLQVGAQGASIHPFKRQDGPRQSFENSTATGGWCNQSLAESVTRDGHVVCLQLPDESTASNTAVSKATTVDPKSSASSLSLNGMPPSSDGASTETKSGTSATSKRILSTAPSNLTLSGLATSGSHILNGPPQSTMGTVSATGEFTLTATTTSTPNSNTSQITGLEGTIAVITTSTAFESGPTRTGVDNEQNTRRSSKDDDRGSSVFIPIIIPTILPTKDGTTDDNSPKEGVHGDEPPKTGRGESISRTTTPLTTLDNTSKSTPETFSTTSPTSTSKVCKKGNAPSKTEAPPETTQDKTYKIYQTAATTAMDNCVVSPQLCEVPDGDDTDELETESANAALGGAPVPEGGLRRLFRRESETKLTLPGGLVNMQGAKYPLRSEVIDSIESGQKQDVYDKPFLFTSELLNVTKVDAMATTSKSVLKRTNVEHIIEVSLLQNTQVIVVPR